MKQHPILFAAVGLVLSLALCSLGLVALGETPVVLLEALSSSLFTSFGLGYSLFYTTPLVFTGLAVALAFHAGLFNIGAEGQLYLGAVAIIAVSVLFPEVPAWVALPLGISAAALTGGIWGGLAGFLKARRGSHEVIVTILLNFVAYSVANYLIMSQLDHPDLQAPETVALPAAYQIPTLHQLGQHFGLDIFKACPSNASLFIAIALAVALHFFLKSSVFGFELRAVGRSNRASLFAGIPVGSRIIAAMALSGAAAGLVGLNDIMGYHHSVIEGFSPGYGFTGIAVALLGRNHPIGILASAFLFGVLHNSARELEFLSDIVSKELSLVLQGVLIAFVAADHLWRSWLTRKRRPT